MAITFPASPSDGDVFTNSTTGVKYIYNATDGVWKTHVWPTNTNYLQLSGGTLTGNLSLGTNDLTVQDINSTTLTTTGGVTVGNGLTVSAGNVVMSNGAGIDFSATADGSGTMQSELLDDYEEGTWTPAFGTNNANWSSSYSDQTGYYVKVGSIVSLSFRLAVISRTTGTGALHIEGLPFTGTGIQAALAISPTFGNWGSTNAPIAGFWQNGVITLKKCDNSDPRNNADTAIDASITASPGLIGTITFRIV